MRTALMILLVILVVIQFIPSGFKNNSFEPSDDFFAHYLANEEIKSTIRSTCYDCHSQEVKNPWYNKVAPIKFWTNGHIEQGRGNLDFSNWGTNDKKEQDHLIDECIEVISKGEMPLSSYALMHKEARLTEADREALITFFEHLR